MSMPQSNTSKEIPFLYAENCPHQPLIFQPFISEIAPKSRKLNRTKKSVLSLNKDPHQISRSQICSFNNRYEVGEHNRELASLSNRIANCKSLSQRKKDHSDAFVYPAYLIRDRKIIKSEPLKYHFRVQKYCQHRKINQQHQDQSNNYNSPFTNQYPPVIPLPIVENKVIHNLPLCASESILSYIISRKLFVYKDLQILKARLHHYYGEKQVQIQWNQLKPHLQMLLSTH